MIANLNPEQANSLHYLLGLHLGEPVRIEGGNGGARHITFPRQDVTYRLDLDGDIQGAVLWP
jgi:hypothetical protein